MRLRTLSSFALAGALVAGLAGSATPARAAADFNPTMTATRSTDAARAAAALHVEIAQADNEQQVGKLRIAVPKTYTFNTDVPGSNGAQIGSAQLQAYIDPRPSTLTIDATVHDGNDGCAVGKQCVLVRANIPGIGAIEFTLEIAQTATEYVIEGDISSLWNSDYVRGIDARLKELTVDINAKTGAHTVFANPIVAGNHPLTYSFTSARINSLGYAGGAIPDCGAVCPIDLESKEYAPNRSNLRAPASAGVSASTTTQTFSWSPVADLNGDTVTYDLEVNGPSGFTATGLTGITYNAGTLAPGSYSWKVTSVDSTGLRTNSVTWGLTVVDAAAALKFVSATNGDVLLVTPGTGFVYRVGGATTTGAEYGALADVADVRGVINYSGSRFSLAGAYDAPTGTAALVLNQGGTALRPLVDPAGL